MNPIGGTIHAEQIGELILEKDKIDSDKRFGLPREEIFLETKLWPSFYEQADAVEKTLERLDTDYIDLLLIHQPAGNYVAGYRQT